MDELNKLYNQSGTMTDHAVSVAALKLCEKLSKVVERAESIATKANLDGDTKTYDLMRTVLGELFS